jgi:hypothetical protein
MYKTDKKKRLCQVNCPHMSAQKIAPRYCWKLNSPPVMVKTTPALLMSWGGI